MKIVKYSKSSKGLLTSKIDNRININLSKIKDILICVYRTYDQTRPKITLKNDNNELALCDEH